MKHFIVGIIAIVLLLFGAVILLSPQEIVEKEIKLESDLNMNDISYETNAQKPEQAIIKLAEFESIDKEGTEVTIYNQNFGLVKDIRNLYLENGLNLVEFEDVASQIDPTSVLFKDLKYSSSFVVEQNYEYDLISKTKLLEKYLDKEIQITSIEGNESKKYSGILLSYTNGIIIQTETGIVSLNPDKIVFPTLPNNLRSKPTLVWKLYTDNPGERLTETTYMTNGINWNAQYIAKVNDSDTKMDFTGWVSIDNKSGTSYNNTALKLVAGDVHKVTNQPRYNYEMTDSVAGSYSKEQFSEESLFEYHMYTLNRKTDLLNNQTKQISLLTSENVPVKKIFYYDGSRQGNKVQTKLQFSNKEDQGLGIPLPKGVVRVYKEDSQGKLQFIGEDSIDHTPKNEDTTLLLGNAFDIVGERTRTKNDNLSKGWYRTSYEIELRNQKDEAVEVVVHEYVGRSWEITQKSHNYEKKSSSEIEFIVSIPANGLATVTYTVDHKYYW